MWRAYNAAVAAASCVLGPGLARADELSVSQVAPASRLTVGLTTGYMFLGAGSQGYRPDAGYVLSPNRAKGGFAEVDATYRLSKLLTITAAVPVGYFRSEDFNDASRSAFVLGDVRFGLGALVLGQPGGLYELRANLVGTAPTGKSGIYGGENWSGSAGLDLTRKISDSIRAYAGFDVTYFSQLDRSHVPISYSAYTGAWYWLNSNNLVGARSGVMFNHDTLNTARTLIDGGTSFFAAITYDRYEAANKKFGLSLSASGIGTSESYTASLNFPVSLR